MVSQSTKYDESAIKTLDAMEHIRLRSGMYIGKLGDGSAPDDGIYVLVKEVVDNSIDEFRMGAGKTIDIIISEKSVTVRDFGRGIPLGKLVDCVSKINTGGKYDTQAFKKSVGMNGVGTKAVNALSEQFHVSSHKDGKMKEVEFHQGKLQSESRVRATKEPNGTLVNFSPDPTIFTGYRFRPGFLTELFKNYAYLNRGLTIRCNELEFKSDNGLLDLLADKTEGVPSRYPVMGFEGEDIAVAFTHNDESSSDQYYSFVNGQYTTLGGTHQSALKSTIASVLVKFFSKEKIERDDVYNGLVGSIAISMQDPIFESQTKVKLGSVKMNVEENPELSVREFVQDFLAIRLEKALHENKAFKDAIRLKLLDSKKEREELKGIKKKARDYAKKASVYNKKLKDSKFHRGDKKKKQDSMIFVTEGDSASGSVVKARDPNYQGVFSLRGKPLNCFPLKKRIVYENEEFNLLQHALKLEEDKYNEATGEIDRSLRYDKVIIATDADVDGKHIRLLILTFFLKFYPWLIKEGYVYLLETPLFRIRNKKETRYCYTEDELKKAQKDIPNHEITRFKGLGEVSADEFKAFIGKDIRLLPVRFTNEDHKVLSGLQFYMDKNTPSRQQYIMENLRKVEE